MGVCVKCGNLVKRLQYNRCTDCNNRGMLFLGAYNHPDNCGYYVHPKPRVKKTELETQCTHTTLPSNHVIPSCDAASPTNLGSS